MDSKMRLVKEVWDELIRTPFDIARLAQEIIEDCGVDAGDVTVQDIVAMFNGDAHIPWAGIAFAFDEALACYFVNEIAEDQFVRAVCVSLYLAQAHELGHGHWASSFDKMVGLVWKNRAKGNYGFRMHFFEEVLRHANVSR